MTFFVPIIYLFAFLGSVLGNRIIFGDEMPYHDLENMNVSCPQWGSCVENRTVDSPGISDSYSCSCDSLCWQYGRCCIDAPHRDNGPPIHECRKKGNKDGIQYFMVHRCSENTGIDSTWKSKCEEEWNGVYDISVLSPVTSLDTKKTYKNYFCFRCHETTDNVVLWNTFLSRNFESSSNNDSGYIVTYSEVIQTSAVMDEKHFSNQFILTFSPPTEIESLPIKCGDIVSDCSNNWTDIDVLDKCRAYTAIVNSTHSNRLYKNSHCAVCNYESLDKIACAEQEPGDDYGYETVDQEPGDDYEYHTDDQEPGDDYDYETVDQEPGHDYENKTLDQEPGHDYENKTLDREPGHDYLFETFNQKPVPDYEFKPFDQNPVHDYKFETFDQKPGHDYEFETFDK